MLFDTSDEHLNLDEIGAELGKSRSQARFIPIALTKACSRRATRAADAWRWRAWSNDDVLRFSGFSRAASCMAGGTKRRADIWNSETPGNTFMTDSNETGPAAVKPCFVICPFGSPESPQRKRSNMLLEYVISPAVRGYGYVVIRADISAMIIVSAIEAPRRITRGTA